MLDVPLKDEEFALIAQIMEGESGIHLRSHKKTLVYNRLRPRLRELGLSSFGQYLERLTADPAELTVAIDLISTNVTHFFREEYQFDYLRKAVLPQFRGEVWRGWSAGCSTGEEAYSLAITCHQALPTNRSWRVLATDISTRALLHAQQGIYPRAAVDHLPPGVVEKYFQISSSEEIQVRSFLRERIWFRYFNLMTEIPLQSPVDVIMCRNVFIYFTKEKQRELLSKFSRVLKPGGLLCLGHAESIDGDWQQEQGWQPLGQAMYKKTGD